MNVKRQVYDDYVKVPQASWIRNVGNRHVATSWQDGGRLGESATEHADINVGDHEHFTYVSQVSTCLHPSR